MSYTQTIYQIVYSTKYRERTLNKLDRPEFFKDITGILKNKKCHLYQVNGVEDHLHIITSLHPSIALASLVKDIKLGSTSFIKQKKIFPDFNGWQNGYAAFTYAMEAKNDLVQYVMNQESHHYRQTFTEELIELFLEHRIEFDEKYLFD